MNELLLLLLGAQALGDTVDYSGPLPKYKLDDVPTSEELRAKEEALLAMLKADLNKEGK